MSALGTEVTIVTQNVDQLHQRAGAKNVIELHGALFRYDKTVNACVTRRR